MTTVIVASVLAVCCGVAAFIGIGAALADSNEIQGTPMDDATAQTLSLAALSCSTLSGPRLAGQVLAGDMSPADFKKWAPWQDANPNDTRAVYYALAHEMCDLVGEVRLAKVDGDEWSNALAAYHSGLPSVRNAKGVPGSAKSYVDTVNGYAAWYEKQSVFGGQGNPVASAAPSAPLKTSLMQVPDADLAAVLAAGRVCSGVTPVRVAAQMMASSAFNANLRSPNGQMGVAQFSAELWNAYAPSSKASPWDPATAIPAMGEAMCDLIGQLNDMSGDPYQLALTAFRVGPTPVRQAMGIPNLPWLRRFVAQVNEDEAYYALDTRLTADAPPSKNAPPPPSKNAPPPPSKNAPTPPSPAQAPTPSIVAYKIVSVNSGKLLSPLNHTTQWDSQLVQHSDTGSKDQLWQIISTGDGHVKIKNVGNGLIVAVLGRALEPTASLCEYNDQPEINNEWTMLDTGGGVYKIQSAHSGLLMSVDAMSTAEDAKVTQYGDNGTANHLWRLVPAS